MAARDVGHAVKGAGGFIYEHARLTQDVDDQIAAMPVGSDHLPDAVLRPV